MDCSLTPQYQMSLLKMYVKTLGSTLKLPKPPTGNQMYEDRSPEPQPYEMDARSLVANSLGITLQEQR